MKIDINEPEIIKDSENVLVRAPFHGRCIHNKFILDSSLDTVKCGICDQSLNPMWVLEQLAIKEHRYVMRLKELHKEEVKAAGKMKCKCKHCGKMTKIHRR